MESTGAKGRYAISCGWAGALLLGAFALPGAAPRAAAPATPLEVYGRLATLEDIVVSPDGSRIAYVQTNGEERNLYIREMDHPKLLGVAHVGAAKERAMMWIDNDHLLIEVSNTSLPPIGFTGPRQEWFLLGTYDVPKQKLLAMDFHVDSVRTFNVVTGRPMVRVVGGATAVFVPGLYVTDRTLPGLFRYDVADKRIKLIAMGADARTDWLVDESGRIAGEFVYYDERKQWELKVPKEARGMRVVASGSAPIDVPRVLGFNASGDSVLMGFLENGDPVWRPFSLKDGSWGAPLGEHERFNRVIEDRNSGRIIGGIGGPGDDRLVFFDNELQAHWEATLRAFPGERVRLMSHSDDYSRIIVRVFGIKDGYVYAAFDWYSHQTVILGKVYEGLAGVSEVQPLTYKAADGLEIPGYLTLPAGRPAAHLALVVLPHGGPAAADDGDFDWWAQAIADQGYAVLQPNFRGSDLNTRFLAAGFGQWGRKMQSDLSDGVAYLADKGVIDPKRVCIVGASYGGYAALAGIALQPRVYRCAVSVAGLSDLRRMLQWTNLEQGRGDNHAQRWWDRFMGASGPNDPALQTISPIEHVSAVSGAVLLIHGKDDTVVPYEQSERMADALRRAGKPVEFVTLKHEDHWLSRSATRLQMLQATIAFLEANNPPD